VDHREPEASELKAYDKNHAELQRKVLKQVKDKDAKVDVYVPDMLLDGKQVQEHRRMRMTREAS
jgi:hypothetical protein